MGVAQSPPRTPMADGLRAEKNLARSQGRWHSRTEGWYPGPLAAAGARRHRRIIVTSTVMAFGWITDDDRSGLNSSGDKACS